MGSTGGDATRENASAVPNGATLRFGSTSGMSVLHEYVNGHRRSITTWKTKAQKYYQVGDSYGVSKFDKRQLKKLYPEANTGHEFPAEFQVLLALLGESDDEEFLVGYRISRIEPRSQDGWSGEVWVQPYYVDAEKKKHLGKSVRLEMIEGGGALPSHFAMQRIAKDLEDTGKYIIKPVIIATEVLLDVALTIITGGGAKALGKELLEDIIKKKVKGKTLTKGMMLLAKKGAKAVLKTAAMLEKTVVAASLAFLKQLTVELGKQSKGQIAVLKLAAQNPVLPATTIVGAKDTYMIDWSRAFGKAATSAVAAVLEKFLEGAFEKKVKLDVNLDKEIIKAVDGSASALLHETKLEEKLRTTVLKWVWTDNIVRLIKAIGDAASEAKDTNEFRDLLRQGIKKELETWFKSAATEALNLAAHAD